MTANANALFNDLTGMGLSQDEAQYYANQYQAGHAIVAVNAGDQWQNVQTVLTSNGAFNYNAQQSGLGTQSVNTGYAQAGSTTDSTQTTAPDYGQTANTGYDQTANTGYDQTNAYAQPGTYAQSGTADTANTGYNTGNTGYADTDEERRLKLREERLNVGKQTVQSGEAGLHKDVIEEQQSVDVPVNREEVWVERRPYGEDRPTDAPVGQDETFRVPVRQDQVTTDKQAVETGEVALGKRTVQDQQRVSDTVRREEARVDTNGDVNVRDPNADQGNY
ncbi:MAG: YsnF/AvaK domain-containing protein, partial [Ktedonobacteraceae bacterium]|nr:YsnF/AvaK domain-containing protein [Ktedonobacteraceae bacterium]